MRGAEKLDSRALKLSTSALRICICYSLDANRAVTCKTGELICIRYEEMRPNRANTEKGGETLTCDSQPRWTPLLGLGAASARFMRPC